MTYPGPVVIAPPRRPVPVATAVLVVGFVLLALLAWGLSHRGSAAAPAGVTTVSVGATSTAAPGAAGGADRGPGGALRSKATYVLGVLDATGRAPDGYVGGRQFFNDGRGGSTGLPRTDGSGTRITYHEYDVNPYHKGVNRGPQRLVVGSDRSAYVTGDHYVTWTRLR